MSMSNAGKTVKEIRRETRRKLSTETVTKTPLNIQGKTLDDI